MRFIRIEGIEGLVFEPEDTGAAKKHPCPDCFFCQRCSDARCALCRAGKPMGHDPASPDGHPDVPPSKR